MPESRFSSKIRISLVSRSWESRKSLVQCYIWSSCTKLLHASPHKTNVFGGTYVDATSPLNCTTPLILTDISGAQTALCSDCSFLGGCFPWILFFLFLCFSWSRSKVYGHVGHIVLYKNIHTDKQTNIHTYILTENLRRIYRALSPSIVSKVDHVYSLHDRDSLEYANIHEYSQTWTMVSGPLSSDYPVLWRTPVQKGRPREWSRDRA